jgi:hypothetical protein
MGIWDDLTGKSSSDASNRAAQDTYRKQRKAGKELRGFGDDYANQYRGLADLFQPWATAGKDALNMYRSGMGLGGDGADFTAAYRGLPGYQSGLQTGQDAAIASANAGGRLNSGATMKALQRYGSDYEDQRVGDYLGRLMGLSNVGQQATGQMVATTGQGLQGQLATRTSAYGGDMNAAGTIGQGMVAGEQAKQQGMTNLMSTAAYLGGAALGGGMGGMGGGGMSSFTNLFKPKPTGNSTGWNVNPWSTAGQGAMNNAAWG